MKDKFIIGGGLSGLIFKYYNPDFTIIDDRVAKNFTTMTFSGYKKNEVMKQFECAILNDDLETSCNWLIELHISGRMDDIWKVIFAVASKNINILNPHISSWIYLKYRKYEMILKAFNKGYEYECRNSQEIRNMFVDIIAILVYSDKSEKLLKQVKITDKDFVWNNYRKKMKNDNN